MLTETKIQNLLLPKNKNVNLPIPLNTMQSQMLVYNIIAWALYSHCNFAAVSTKWHS